jgi:hypothetical protein
MHSKFLIGKLKERGHLEDVVVDGVILRLILKKYISYEGEKDLDIKAANFVRVLGIINQIFKPSLVSSHTRIRVYKTLARPVLSYGSETWTVRRTDERRLISAEMRLLRKTAGYTLWDNKSNEDILTIKNLTDNIIHKSVQEKLVRAC